MACVMALHFIPLYEVYVYFLLQWWLHLMHVGKSLDQRNILPCVTFCSCHFSFPLICDCLSAKTTFYPNNFMCNKISESNNTYPTAKWNKRKIIFCILLSFRYLEKPTRVVNSESTRTGSPCSTYVIRINVVKSVEERAADIGKPPEKALLCRNQAAFRSLVMQHPDTNTDCVLLRLRKAEGDLASKHVRCASGTIYIPLKLPPFTRTGKVIGETLIILLHSFKIPPPSFFSVLCPVCLYF